MMRIKNRYQPFACMLIGILALANPQKKEKSEQESSIKVQVEGIFGRLVPVPDDVEVNGVDSVLFVGKQRLFPSIARHPIVIKSRAVHEERLVIDMELRISVDHHHPTRNSGPWELFRISGDLQSIDDSRKGDKGEKQNQRPVTLHGRNLSSTRLVGHNQNLLLRDSSRLCVLAVNARYLFSPRRREGAKNRRDR